MFTTQLPANPTGESLVIEYAGLFEEPGVRVEKVADLADGAVVGFEVQDNLLIIKSTTDPILVATIIANWASALDGYSLKRIGTSNAATISPTPTSGSTPRWTLTLADERPDPSGLSPTLSGGLIFSESAQDHLFIEEGTGNVGIGTVLPKARLDVNGSLRLSDADIPIGLTAEANSSALQLDVNYQLSDADPGLKGAAFRID
ncbi:MAG: hypothetical protein KDC75_26650, partial [Phaeodactylibacter sp.]|nr:hypothetical protein [Phaeodactylibacter sp.]